MALGYEFVPGMKVSWIVTNSGKTPQEIEPYISGKKFECTPDWKYYAGRVAQTIARATENFGWSEKDLLTGSQQAGLFSDAFKEEKAKTSEGERPKPAPKSEVKKTDKRLSLEDFM
jgi:DNA polymerase I